MADGMTVFRVRLSAQAEAAIEEEIFRTAVDSESELPVETGGWLWTPQGEAWWGDGVNVEEASGPGVGAEKTYNSLTLSTDYMRDLDELFRRDGLELCGGWHLHPGNHRDPTSDEDIDRIAYVLDLRASWRCRTARALEIVVNRHPEGGWNWVCTPWVFYKGASRTGLQGVWPEATLLEGTSHLHYKGD